MSGWGRSAIALSVEGIAIGRLPNETAGIRCLPVLVVPTGSHGLFPTAMVFCFRFGFGLFCSTVTMMLVSMFDGYSFQEE